MQPRSAFIEHQRYVLLNSGELERVIQDDFTQLYPTLTINLGYEKPSPNDIILKEIEDKLKTQKTVNLGACPNPVKKFIKKSKHNRKNRKNTF